MVRRRARNERPSREPAPTTLLVFIAYGEVSAARRALTSLAARVGAPGASRIAPMLWRFDQLDRECWRAMALRDARRASAVVLALGDDEPANAGAVEWLREMAARGSAIRTMAHYGDEFWTVSLEAPLAKQVRATAKAAGRSPTPLPAIPAAASRAA